MLDALTEFPRAVPEGETQGFTGRRARLADTEAVALGDAGDVKDRAAVLGRVVVAATAIDLGSRLCRSHA
ncbi:hypothetical protein [Streptomyces sp. NPDC046821]|uniref:hypothetical protein n=1 Tax=Streptomyces sp. NPDC046821 TaxID=3154702 RepID=UPI0033CB7A90